ncbi:MAG: STAS domain-containing protein [Planctomycetota bacterium]|nr:STAS domain-containing protein [Planctomycetota bacterium]
MQYDLTIRNDPPKDRIATIGLGGVVDAHTLDKFEAALRSAAEGDVRSVVLDCEELRYINSSGFGELIRYSDRLREKGGSLVLARVPPKVGIILEMLGLKRLIPTAPSVAEAILAAQQPPPPALPSEKAPEPEAAPAPTPEPERVPAPAPRTASPKITPPAPPRLPIDQPGPPATAASPGPSSPIGPPSRIDVRDRFPEAKQVTEEAAAELPEGEAIVRCALCDVRMHIGGRGRWLCPSCGAPFTVSPEGGLAFEWTESEAEAMHLTFDVAPRTLAAFAGVLEGILTERRVSHARTRRFSREAAHVCHLVSQHAYGSGRPGPLHVLLLAGPERLRLRIVDRGSSLGTQAHTVFETQARLFLDFRYLQLSGGVHVTELAFAYTGSGVFVA